MSHPATARAAAPASAILDDYSLEITARDTESLRASAPLIPAGTTISVTFLPGEAPEQRIAAARLVRALGFEPMPHFSARCLTSREEFETYLVRLAEEAGVRRCFAIAGDAQTPDGPFSDTAALLSTGAFERAGIRMLGVGGHPEGHPNMTEVQCWEVLERKCADITARGMAPLIVTQFGFDTDRFLAWLRELRERGIEHPVRIGVPGPAGIKTLLRFAARCGVGASASVMAKYGISITRLMGTAGPDKMVARLSGALGPRHGAVRLHFYPFGGLGKTVEWITARQASGTSDLAAE